MKKILMLFLAVSGTAVSGYSQITFGTTNYDNDFKGTTGWVTKQQSTYSSGEITESPVGEVKVNTSVNKRIGGFSAIFQVKFQGDRVIDVSNGNAFVKVDIKNATKTSVQMAFRLEDKNYNSSTKLIITVPPSATYVTYVVDFTAALGKVDPTLLTQMKITNPTSAEFPDGDFYFDNLRIGSTAVSTTKTPTTTTAAPAKTPTTNVPKPETPTTTTTTTTTSTTTTTAAKKEIVLKEAKGEKFGFTILIPEGAKEVQNSDMFWVQSLVLPGGFYSIDVTVLKFTSPAINSMDDAVRYTNFPMETATIEKTAIGSDYLIVKKPQGTLSQEFWYLAKANEGYLAVKCSGPPAQSELCLKIVKSLKSTK
jgi:hypothetical protein